LVAGVPPALRLNGEIVLINSPALAAAQLRTMIYSFLNSHQIEALERDLELCFSRDFDKVGRFRVTIYFQASSPELSIRRCSTKIPRREELGLPAVVDNIAQRLNGLILFTGPTGTGKTTSMHCLIDMINCERRCKIVTIEDPVEYIHHQKKAIIVQQEMRADVRSFPAALRHVLRQDPDVICVGEMRDLETIETALIAAETGHLVLATLHTPNAQGTIERIVSVFPGNQQNQIIAQLASGLQAVIAQLLFAGQYGRAQYYPRTANSSD
jgi:twitching motility protein PilT